MADKDLSRKSHHIRDRKDVWWYEEPGGICVVVKGTPSFIMIPWRSIRAALKRKDQSTPGGTEHG